MRDYGAYSFWLETAADDLTPRPPLAESTDVDVAIVGAGYSGLWTAYYLLRQAPGTRVAIVEREIAGFGGSGRNGGWCSSGFPISLIGLQERFGRDGARAVVLALYDAVDEVGRITAAEDIDAQYRKAGALRIARGPHQLPAIQRAYATYEQLGLANHYRLLSAEETAERIRVSKAMGSLFTNNCAVVHPGRLVRGLARAVERRGGTIYEQTTVTDFAPGPSPTLQTDRGRLRAKTIVLAGEAYLTRLAALHRQLIPLYSLIALTEPLTEAQWSAIGWQGRECVSSNRYTVDYLSRTADGRLLFGSRGAPYHFGSHIADAYDRHEPTFLMIQDLVREWFPTLADVAFTHHWGGPVGMPRDWFPTIGYDPATGVATARGYTGQGVATSNLAGRALANLILGVDSTETRLPIIGHRSRNWEPEPLRWLAIRYVQEAHGRIDAQAERTGQPPTGRTLAERLAAH